jgi:hypothetical protein
VSQSHLLAVAYLQARPGDNWRWAEGTRVLVSLDGRTLAFREEVEAVLARLGPDGLPPFSLVVTLLAACRGLVPEKDLLAASSGTDNEIDDSLRQLAEIELWPKDLIGTLEGKIVLAETVFEAIESVRLREAASEIVAGLKSGRLTETELNRPSESASRVNLLGNIQLLCRGLHGVTPESLALRIRTGLDQLPVSAQLLLKPSECIRRLLAQLKEDSELPGLARVTRDIMAAIYLPRALSETDQLALGGVSDITNRGSLDRLLLSELAHDDLTLATRVALGEALYIRREPPARHPRLAMAVLLDAGVRMWGLPRVFATAAALALIAKEDRSDEVRSFRATAKGIEPVDLLTRQGLMDHLAMLETDAQPGAALPDFCRELADLENVEAVVVTHRDALADPRFREALTQITHEPLYIAAVDRTGVFELHRHPLQGQKPIAEAAIVLDDLLGPSKTTPPLLDECRDPNLPLILSTVPFPFLLPVRGKVDRAIKLDDGGICVVNSRCLMLWANPNEGARLLTAALPIGPTALLHVDGERRVHVLKRCMQGERTPLVSVDLETGEIWTKSLAVGTLFEAVHIVGGILFVIVKGRILAFDLQSGDLLHRLWKLPPGTLWCHSRYFSSQRGWQFLNWDGFQVTLLPVPLPAQLRGKMIIGLFEREGYEGMWAVTEDGQIVSPGGAVVFQLHCAISLLGIATDGHQLAVRDRSQNTKKLVYLPTRRIVEFEGGRLSAETAVTLPKHSVRNRFTRIAVVSSHALWLCSLNQQWLQLVCAKNGICLVGAPQPQANPPSSHGFVPVPVARDALYLLKVATWQNGSQAFLDSRGILHLKSSDPALPEVSLVLTDGPLAVWSSDGLIAGPSFFIGQQTPAPIEQMWKRITDFIERAV